MKFLKNLISCLDIPGSLNKILKKNSANFNLPKPAYVAIERMESIKNIDYEKLYINLCNNSWQKDYTVQHKESLEINENKFLVFSCPHSGWGNRLRDLLTTFHFSVIANKTFIINCNSPSPLDKYLVPRNIKWNYKINKTRLTVRRLGKVALDAIKNPEYKFIEQMLNYPVEDNPQLVGNRLNWIQSRLKYNLPVWPNLRQMFGCSFYYLFAKSNMLQERLNEWKEKLGFYKNIVIGIHIRQGDSAIFNNTHNKNDKRFKDPKDIDFSFGCAESLQKYIEKKYNTTNVIWFLAADSEEMKSYAKQKYGNKVNYISGPIEHVGHPHRGNEDAGHLSMFLDYFLLRDANYRLYTVPSTFDDAVNFITLGSKNVFRTFSRGKRVCVIPRLS